MQIVETLFLLSLATSVTDYPGPYDSAYLPFSHDYWDYTISDARHVDDGEIAYTMQVLKTPGVAGPIAGPGTVEFVNEALLSLPAHYLKGTPAPTNVLSLLEARDVDLDSAVLEPDRVSEPCPSLSVRRASVDISPKCFADFLTRFALRMVECLKQLVLDLVGILVE